MEAAWAASLIAEGLAVYALPPSWWRYWLTIDLGISALVWLIFQSVLLAGFQNNHAWPTVYSIIFMASQLPMTIMLGLAGVEQLPERQWLRPSLFTVLILLSALTAAAAILPEAYLPLIRSASVAKLTVRISILAAFVIIGVEWTWARVWWAIYLTGLAAVETVYIQSEGKLMLSQLSLVFSSICYLAIFASRPLRRKLHLDDRHCSIPV